MSRSSTRANEQRTRLALEAEAHERKMVEQSQRAMETATHAAAAAAAADYADLDVRKEAVAAAEGELKQRREDIEREAARMQAG